MPPAANQDDLLQQQTAQFFDSTSDAIIFLDSEQKILFLNRRAKELLSLGRDLVGRNLFESFPALLYSDSPYVENLRLSVESAVGGDFEGYFADPLNLWLRVQSYPAMGGTVMTLRDVTAERLARRALQRKTEEAQRQHAELETIYRTAPIGLALFDTTDYRYLRLNDRQAAFFGLKPEQIVGRTVTEMAPIEGLKGLFDQVLAGTPVVNYPLEGTLVTDPTDYRYWTVSYFPVHAPDGSIQAITAASLEVTAQKKAEKALIQSEKIAVVGRLVSSIAHEINNPLEAVTNLLYLAHASNNIDHIREYLQSAEVELRRASAITTQTLRFHKQTTSPRAIDLPALVNEVLTIWQGRIANANVTVETDWAVTRRIRCFDGEVRQVVSNLINNALDAMPGGGRLVLRAREGTNWCTGEEGICLAIADTGVGMTREVRHRLFDPFFTTKGLTGTGLGLWVAKEIVDRHRGALRVRSSQRPKQCGTVFTLFLPFPLPGE